LECFTALAENYSANPNSNHVLGIEVKSVIKSRKEMISPPETMEERD